MECRYLPLKQPPFSLSPVSVSIFTFDGKSNGCKSKSVSPCRPYPLVVFLKLGAEKETESRSVGRAHVGGPFEMVTHDGKPFTDKDLLGKWSLIYFGFTNCPDICPEELDKMGVAVTELGPHPLLCM